MNVCFVGGNGMLGKPMSEWTKRFYPVTIADKKGGLPTPEATQDADLVIVIVDTPSKLDGSFNIRNVLDACSEIDVSRWRMVAIASTVNPGDIEQHVAKAFQGIAHADFGLAYTPEFVRKGMVYEDFARPQYVIAGVKTQRERMVLERFYSTVCRTPVTFMSIPSAEIMKIGLNTMLTTKLGKANEIAWLCQKTPGADARDVLDAIGMDARIASAYMHEGPPSGGPCFPRDDRAFAYALRSVGMQPYIALAVNDFRRYQIRLMRDLVFESNKTIGVMGLSYKPGIADDQGSAPALLAALLQAETYDPDLPSSCDTLQELVDKCDVLVVGTPCNEFHDLLGMDLGNRTVWDWWGMFGDTFRRFGAYPV